MKKGICYLVMIMVIILGVSGCGSSSHISSSKSSLDDSNYDVNKCSGYNSDTEISTDVKVYSSKNRVLKVETVETVSGDASALNSYEIGIKNLYDTMNKNYGGYKYTINNNGSKLVVRTTIDYKKMNLKKFIEDYDELSIYVDDDNYLTLRGIAKMYEGYGIECGF